MILPTRGSKEAVFHIALSLVGRAGGRKHILYPDPGYPVYRTSALFAGGIPYSIRLRSEDNYLMQPWNLPSHIIKDTAAIWVNYPHNPTGAIASKKYWEQLIDWCQTQNIILLADDCYADIYTSELESSLGKPINALEISTDKVLSFMSLSKRSGFTGYRAGFIAGDPNLLKLHTRARANFGLANPLPIQKAAIVAWNDDTHVEKRRKIFEERLNVLAPFLVNKGLLMEIPKATFYLWCKIPKDFQNDDVGFCLSLANSGIICSPSSWLSEGQKGYFRLALVPETKDIKKAIDLMNNLF
jgi:aspartate/methionine/tyrosine aminotransferase